MHLPPHRSLPGPLLRAAALGLAAAAFLDAGSPNAPASPAAAAPEPVPARPQDPAEPPTRWRMLDLPPAVLRLPDGLGAGPPAGPWHVAPPLERPDDGSRVHATLPLSDLLPVLEQEVRRAARGVRLRPGGDRVLMEGPAAGLDHLQAFVHDLGALEERAAVRVRGSLSLGDGEPVDLARAVPSGDRARWSRRSVRTFVGSWTAEVASDSAVAEPQLWTVHPGWTLDLRCCRAPGGDGALLLGSLDLTRLEGLDDFDPATPDLGLVQVPRVRTLSLAFSGFVRPGQPLELELVPGEGAHEAVRLTLDAEVEAGELEVGGYAVLDAAALAPPPGAERDAADLDAAGLVALLDSSLRPTEPALAVGRRLFVPRGDAAFLAAARDLLEGLVAPRRVQRRVRVALDGGSLAWPCVDGLPTTLRAGEETTYLARYRTELATDSWLAEPEVERAFDGLELSARLRGARLLGEWSLRRGVASGALEARDLADIGSLVWREEALLREPLRHAAGASGTGPLGGPGGPTLWVE